MDYHSVHGHDISSFDISDTHRLPTIPASQALDQLSHQPSLQLSTGLESLDRALTGPAYSAIGGSSLRGGLKRGQVTEIWGPPGMGKTALAIQATAHAICSGHDVVWVDCFQTVQKQRVLQVVESARRSKNRPAADHVSAIDLTKLTHYSCLTLPHLMALLSRPSAKSIGRSVALVVVSSVSALLNAAFPRSHDGKMGPKTGIGLSASAKRVQGLQFVINALQNLAETRNCAVLVLSQCATRMQSKQGATLVAAVNASVWEQGVATRLVLFRDWARQGKPSGSVFMAGLQKLDGKVVNDVVVCAATFNVEMSGVTEIDFDASAGSVAGPGDVVRRKRKLGQTEFEVPDSEDDEDYGWADEDEAAMPAPPPQWQGSEDIILGQEVCRSDEGTAEEETDQDMA